MQLVSYAFDRGIDPYKHETFKWRDKLLIRKKEVQLGCTIIQKDVLADLLIACEKGKRKSFPCQYLNWLDDRVFSFVSVRFRDDFIGLDAEKTNLVRWIPKDQLIKRIKGALGNAKLV